jgi:hypothetical protein
VGGVCVWVVCGWVGCVCVCGGGCGVAAGQRQVCEVTALSQGSGRVWDEHNADAGSCSTVRGTAGAVLCRWQVSAVGLLMTSASAVLTRAVQT